MPEIGILIFYILLGFVAIGIINENVHRINMYKLDFTSEFWIGLGLLLFWPLTVLLVGAMIGEEAYHKREKRQSKIAAFFRNVKYRIAKMLNFLTRNGKTS